MKKEKQQNLNSVSLECCYCDKTFKYNSDRKRHELNHSTPLFQCSVCNKSFGFKSALVRHEKQHNRTNTVPCKECGKTFPDDILLQRHIKYAHKGSFTCTKCTSTYSSEAALKTHMLSHRPSSERRYQCSHRGCTKKFNFKHHLRDHELTHTDTKLYSCNVCGKGFIQLQHLKDHLKTHDPESWLPCLVVECKKTFATDYNRKRHLRVYHDKTLCPTCGDLLEYIDKEAHAKKCDGVENVDTKTKTVKNDDTFQMNDQTNNPEVLKTQLKLNGDVPKIEMSVLNYDIALLKIDFDEDDNVTDCQSAVGSCIVTGSNDVNESCLCAQMKQTDRKEVNKSMKEETKDMVTVEVKSESKIPVLIDTSEADIMQETVFEPCPRSKPALELKDGVIKLTDTYDFYVPVVKSEVNDSSRVPENSCKAVLGNCIVSGNGTMGEGCLCARMSLETQNDQEIESMNFW